MSGGAGVGHLSIGEVLSLVQEDFPDVTISKIRFLESQGLIAPERTAAGYRKFYDSDIERLRWILRQQRDHFLPLKVIRKMLDQGVDVSPEGQPTLWSSAATGPASGTSEEQPEEGEAGASRTIDVTDASGAADAGEDAEEDHAEEDDDGGEGAAQRSSAHPAVASSARRTPRSQRSSAPTPSAGRPEEEAAAGERAGSAGAGETAEQRRQRYATPADVVAALQEDPRSRRPQPARAEDEASEGGPEEAEAAAEPATRRGKGRRRREDVRMNRAELCEAAGIAPELLADLEEYGLVEPSVLGGDPQYDGDALEVAKIAARYAELGVGARHLRMYKVAAEREAGFVEQLVVPLLKQRNPAAREQAIARAEELQDMGAELHAVLLRRRLGPNFGR